MSARVVGLGHIGVYVRDLELMEAFYRDFMGMTLTKRSDTAAFFSTDPERSDHEVALAKGRPSAEDPHLINQISLRVETLADLRDFQSRIKARGLRIQRLVTHVSAIGCYFDDPEGNTNRGVLAHGPPVVGQHQRPGRHRAPRRRDHGRHPRPLGASPTRPGRRKARSRHHNSHPRAHPGRHSR